MCFGRMNKPWTKLLEQKFGKADDDEEKRAREEKTAALAELAEARYELEMARKQVEELSQRRRGLFRKAT